jgi:hypothetical protein
MENLELPSIIAHANREIMVPKESYVVLNCEGLNILGRVTSISTNELTFLSISEKKIPCF